MVWVVFRFVIGFAVGAVRTIRVFWIIRIIWTIRVLGATTGKSIFVF